uniref:COMM domain-containing protein n=1 Tax=Ascaris lumbricoides TaxID=6252 RepID=A0A0M3I8I5_ASCLU
MRKYDRETLHNKARAILGVNEQSDDHMNATVDLVSLLRMSPSMDETSLPKKNYEVKMKDMASTLGLKKKNVVAAAQSWFCTTTLFCYYRFILMCSNFHLIE